MFASKRGIGRPKRIRRGSSLGAILAATFAAIGILVFALNGFDKNVEATQPQSAEPEEMIYVPTPSRPIARGERIATAEFLSTPWPRARLSNEYLSDLTTLHGAVALTSLPPHLPIPKAAIGIDVQDGNAVIEGIPSGMRAITVKVDAESAVEGWARSGSYVDVILLRSGPDDQAGMIAKVIAENVRILSAGRSTEPLQGQTSAPRAPTTVTMLVTQEDALTIKTASSIGKLTFSLRGAGDERPTFAKAVHQKDILDGARTILPKKPIYQGTATGPDGQQFVLGEDARWVRTKAHAMLKEPTSVENQR